MDLLVGFCEYKLCSVCLDNVFSKISLLRLCGIVFAQGVGSLSILCYHNCYLLLALGSHIPADVNASLKMFGFNLVPYVPCNVQFQFLFNTGKHAILL
jgi:hypothetical protein